MEKTEDNNEDARTIASGNTSAQSVLTTQISNTTESDIEISEIRFTVDGTPTVNALFYKDGSSSRTEYSSQITTASPDPQTISISEPIVIPAGSSDQLMNISLNLPADASYRELYDFNLVGVMGRLDVFHQR